MLGSGNFMGKEVAVVGSTWQNSWAGVGMEGILMEGCLLGLVKLLKGRGAC